MRDVSLHGCDDHLRGGEGALKGVVLAGADGEKSDFEDHMGSFA